MKRSWLAAAAALLAVTGLLLYSGEVAQGVRSGLQSCGELLIPSLFPFMILAALIGCTTAGSHLSLLVSRLLGPITGLPEPVGAAFFMSLIGGFPVGARMLSQMLERGEIDAKTASRALCCCVNAGPSFLITAVGLGLFGSRAAGALLLGAQLLSALCIAALEFRLHPASALAVSTKNAREPDAFVSSVRSAAAGMLGVCMFVVAFSAITALLRAAGILPLLSRLLAAVFPALGGPFFDAMLGGLLEVTNGCIAAGALHSFAGFALCAFLVSFSSLSILFQVKSCFSPTCGVHFAPLYRSRFTHALLTSLLAMLGWRWLPQPILGASALLTAPVAQANPNMLVTGCCIAAMFSILLFTPHIGHTRKRSFHPQKSTGNLSKKAV